WVAEGRSSFEAIKEAISQAPTLVNLDLSKEFILYAFGGSDTISAILVQQNKKGIDQPIVFFSEGLEDYE
ncbi:hypothetical protein KI387_009965, partial [Taxus chinensis]